MKLLPNSTSSPYGLGIQWGSCPLQTAQKAPRPTPFCWPCMQVPPVVLFWAKEACGGNLTKSLPCRPKLVFLDYVYGRLQTTYPIRPMPSGSFIVVSFCGPANTMHNLCVPGDGLIVCLFVCVCLVGGGGSFCGSASCLRLRAVLQVLVLFGPQPIVVGCFCWRPGGLGEPMNPQTTQL